MNFMEYVCRGIVRSEDAIGRLNKNVVKLAKCNNKLATTVALLGIAAMMSATVICANIKDIERLEKQNADLKTQVKDLAGEVKELKEQKGA